MPKIYLHKKKYFELTKRAAQHYHNGFRYSVLVRDACEHNQQNRTFLCRKLWNEWPCAVDGNVAIFFWYVDELFMVIYKGVYIRLAIKVYRKKVSIDEREFRKHNACSTEDAISAWKQFVLVI